jgi:hypothetical protein
MDGFVRDGDGAGETYVHYHTICSAANFVDQQILKSYLVIVKLWFSFQHMRLSMNTMIINYCIAGFFTCAYFLSLSLCVGAVSVYNQMLDDEVLPDGMTFHLASRAHAMLVCTH